MTAHPDPSFYRERRLPPYVFAEVNRLKLAYRHEGRDVIDYVARRVAPYKKVRRVAFRDEIPTSASGKILRRELVEASD